LEKIAFACYQRRVPGEGLSDYATLCGANGRGTAILKRKRQQKYNFRISEEWLIACQNPTLTLLLKVVCKKHATKRSDVYQEKVRATFAFNFATHFMSRLPLSLLLLCWCLLWGSLGAHAQPVADIRPLLKALTKEQKQELIRFLHHLGAQPDDEIQSAYRQLPEKHQKQVLQLLDFYRQSAQRELLTAVVWNPDTLWLGNANEGQPLVGAFRVTNTGQYPYWIYDAKGTCDCVVASVPDHPILPGESALLRVSFNSNGKLGESRPVIIVYDNSAPNKRSVLHVKAHVQTRRRIVQYPWEK